MNRRLCGFNLFLLLFILLTPVSLWATVEISGEKTILLDENPIDVAPSADGRWIFVLTKDNHLLVYTGDGRLHGRILLKEAFDAVRIGAGEESLLLVNRKEKRIKAISLEFIKQIDTKGAPYKGPADAPVEVVIFSEFQCPYCARLVPILDAVIKKYGPKVKLVFKNYPRRTHRYSFMAAAAALAALDQGKFWETHDLLFKDINRLSPHRIQQVPAELGLDADKFNKEFKSPAIMDRIRKDIEDGNKAGVKGTPTVYVNGRLVRDKSLQGIQTLIDSELAKLVMIEKPAGIRGVNP